MKSPTNVLTLRPLGGTPNYLLLCFCLAFFGLLAGCVTDQSTVPAKSANASELYGSISAYAGDYNRPVGPSVRIHSVDGKKTFSSSPETPCHVPPGKLKIQLAIIRLDIESMPTFEIPVGANRKYKFSVSPAGYEYRVTMLDITDGMPGGILFVAEVTRSRTPTIKYILPPRPSPAPQVSNEAVVKEPVPRHHTTRAQSNLR